MQLSPARFNAHIKGMGQDVAWRQSYRCPCFNAASGAAKADCPLCRAKGWTWSAEVTTRIGLTNANSKRAMEQFGIYEPGDVLLTLPSDSSAYAAGPQARFRALNSTSPFSIALTRGDGDRLLGVIQSFTRCFWLNGPGTAEIEGGLPTADASGNLTWSSGAPPAGQQYSLSGVRYDEYYLPLDMPSDRNHHAGATLPRKALARKFDLFGR